MKTFGHAIHISQLELALAGPAPQPSRHPRAPRPSTPVRRGRRFGVARWWFEQMRHVVNTTRGWEDPISPSAANGQMGLPLTTASPGFPGHPLENPAT